MILSDEDIAKYQEIHKKYYGVEISKEEAYKSGSALIRFIEVVCKTVAREQSSCTQEKDKVDS